MFQMYNEDSQLLPHPILPQYLYITFRLLNKTKAALFFLLDRCAIKSNKSSLFQFQPLPFCEISHIYIHFYANVSQRSFWTALIIQLCVEVCVCGHRGKTCKSFPDNGRVLSPLSAAAGPVLQLINPVADTPHPLSPQFTYHPAATTAHSK